MAKSERVTYFKITLEDKPGALLEIAKQLKSKNVGLAGLKALGLIPGQTEAYLVPKNPEKLQSTLQSMKVTFEKGVSFFVKGSDKTGALVKSLEAIAQAGINIMSTDALAVGGKYGVFFRVGPNDVEKTAKALGAK